MKVLITGSNGQLGRALQTLYPDGVLVDVNELDITSEAAVQAFDYTGIEAIINAAAFTNVDGCELPENHDIVWAVNVDGVKNLAHIAKEHDVPLVHISTDYVFDGNKDGAYSEDDQPHPLSEYGKSKAASEEAAHTAPKHYLLRTSWVIGDGHNFVRTMLGLAQKDANPSVVNDQVGRPTFTDVLAKAIQHLLENKAPYGVYNVTNDGEPVNWADFTRAIFTAGGFDNTVADTSTEEYFAGKENIAPRPKNSVFDLSKIKGAGVDLPDWRDSLKEYVKQELSS